MTTQQASTNPLDPATPVNIAAPVHTNTPDVVVPGTPAATPAVGAATTTPAITPPVATTSSVSQQPGPKTATVLADGDIPDDAELLSLSKAAFRSRLDRHTKSELRARFGTDNPDDIKAKLDKLADYERQAEEQRLANLSEIERERELRTKAEEDAGVWRTKYETARDAQEIAQAHNRVDSIAAKHLKPKVKGVVMELFREKLRGMPDNEIDALTDEQIEGFFADQVKETPEFGLTAQVAPIATAPLTNGVRTDARGDAPPPAGGARQEPNFSPSAANAMSPQEARAKAAAAGYRW